MKFKRVRGAVLAKVDKVNQKTFFSNEEQDGDTEDDESIASH